MKTVTQYIKTLKPEHRELALPLILKSSVDEEVNSLFEAIKHIDWNGGDKGQMFWLSLARQIQNGKY